MSFVMQTTSLPQGAEPYEFLRFETPRPGAVPAEHSRDPVLAATVGRELEYGHLFACLFRRFGSPNHPWDHPTELAHYLLTTPRRDLFLSVVPRIDGRTDLSLRFLAPASVCLNAQIYLDDMADAWGGRAIGHKAERGMPPWLQARASSLSRRHVGDETRGDATASLWRDALRTMPGDSTAASRRISAFLRACLGAYLQVEPHPHATMRTEAPTRWEPQDPLRPYAIAAVQALRYLMRPVRIGRMAIDVFGARPADDA